MEAEIEKLEDEEANLRAYIGKIVKDLKDLQFGQLSDGQLKNNAINGLASLQEACARKT